MKKILLSTILSFSVFSLFAQFPCVSKVQINNGGGSTNNCAPAQPGYVVTGKITLSFQSAVNPADIPKILSAYDVTNQVSVLGVEFGSGTLNSNGTVSYCYYSGPNNANNLLGANTQYTFAVSYQNGTVSCGGEQITLPVHFSSFNALRISPSSVSVSWTTASEQNNRGFNVQKNVNGEWKTIAFVFSQTEDGNSSSDLSYSYTDPNTEKGVSQYRVQQVDLDGRFSYSEIRAIRGETAINKLVVYPNPSADGKVNVVFDDNNTIHDVIVTDMQGRIIKSFKGITNNILVVENLKSGFYTIKVTNRINAASSMQKVIIK